MLENKLTDEGGLKKQYGRARAQLSLVALNLMLHNEAPLHMLTGCVIFGKGGAPAVLRMEVNLLCGVRESANSVSLMECLVLRCDRPNATDVTRFMDSLACGLMVRHNEITKTGITTEVPQVLPYRAASQR
jgi:hypothetical protein